MNRPAGLTVEQPAGMRVEWPAGMMVELKTGVVLDRYRMFSRHRRIASLQHSLGGRRGSGNWPRSRTKNSVWHCQMASKR